MSNARHSSSLGSHSETPVTSGGFTFIHELGKDPGHLHVSIF